MRKQAPMTTDDLKIPKVKKEKEAHPVVMVMSRTTTALLFIISIPFQFILTFTLVLAMFLTMISLLIAYPIAFLAKKVSFMKFVFGPVKYINKSIELFNYNINKVLDILYHAMTHEKFDEETFKKNYFK